MAEEKVETNDGTVNQSVPETTLTPEEREQRNLEYITGQITSQGYPGEVTSNLRELIASGLPEFFSFNLANYDNGDTLTSKLNFSRSEQGMTFYNSVDVQLTKGATGEQIDNRFYINKGANLKQDEMYNIMNGRSVFKKNLLTKEGKKYDAWLKLDQTTSDKYGNNPVKHFSGNNFDVAEHLNTHSFKGKENLKYFDQVVDRLYRGDLVPLVYTIGGVEQNRHVEADGQFKTLLVYDESMKRLDRREEIAKAQNVDSPSQDQAKKNTQKVYDDEAPEIGEKTAKKSRKKVGM